MLPHVHKRQKAHKPPLRGDPGGVIFFLVIFRGQYKSSNPLYHAGLRQCHALVTLRP